MFDPFRRARVRSQKKLRRAAVSAMNDAWGSLLPPSKPDKRKPAKGTKSATKPTKQGTAARKGEVDASKRTSAKSKPPATSQSKSTVPRGASFKNGTYECAFGTRAYKLYLPVAAKTVNDPLPLVVMLHGCGQTPQDFARGTGMNALAEEFGFQVLYPAQARDAQRNRCWNWFKRDDQERGAGEPALIASLTQHVINQQNVDLAKVYIAGLSAGAAAALIVATAYPDMFAAVGVHSGLGIGAAHDATSAAHAMNVGATGRRHDAQMPTIIFHGDSDRVVNPRNGRFVAIRALEHYNHLDQVERTGRIAGGRDYTRTSHRVGRGRAYVEKWVVHGAGHAWSGGHSAGSYTDPKGPDASREMVQFFMRHRTTAKRRATAVI